MGIKKLKPDKFYIMCPAAVLCTLLWGSAFPVIKIGYNSLNIANDDTFSIILFAGLRFIIAGFLTLVIFSLPDRKLMLPEKKSLPKIVVLSVFQTIMQYLFFYLGLAYTTGVRASIINALGVFFVLLISAFLFRQERFNLKKAIGCLLGFIGVALAGGLFSGSFGSQFKIGDLFIVLSAVGYALSSSFMKKYAKDDNPAMLSGYQFILGGCVLASIGYAMGGRINFNAEGLIIIVYLAFVSAVAYSLWSILLKYNEVSRVTVFSLFTPIFGFVLSYVMLGEDSGRLFNNLAGLILVVLGMLLLNINRKSDKRIDL